MEDEKSTDKDTYRPIISKGARFLIRTDALTLTICESEEG